MNNPVDGYQETILREEGRVILPNTNADLEMHNASYKKNFLVFISSLGERRWGCLQ